MIYVNSTCEYFISGREREIVVSVLTSLIVFMTLPSTLDGLANVFDHF